MTDGDAFKIVRREMPQDNPGSIPGFAAEQDLEFALYVKDTVANCIRTYASSDPSSEIGGVLLGRHYQSSNSHQTVVEINDYVPLPSANRSRSHYTFDAPAIRTLRQSKQTNSRYLVGWFHSHPGFGDPFMSTDDIDLHKRNFGAPWYVSCVIGGGQYSLPLGFFRVDGGKLLPVEQYFIAMTAPALIGASPSGLLRTSVGEASRSFARASAGEDRPLDVSSRLLRGVFADLGIRLSASLNRYLDKAIAKDDATPTRARPLSAFVHLFELAKLLKADSVLESELERVAEDIPFIHLLSDSLLPVFATSDLGDIFATSNSRCLSATRGGSSVMLGNFDANIFIRIDLTSGDSIMDLAFSDDSLGWILMEDGRVTRLDFVHRGPDAGLDSNKHPTRSFLVGKKGGGDKQLKIHNDRLYIRDAKHIWQSADFSTGEVGERVGSMNEVKSPSDQSFLVTDYHTGQLGLTYQAGGKVFYRSSYDQADEVEFDVPSWYEGHCLKGASASSVGVCLLTEREATTNLWIFAITGELRSVLVQDPLEPATISNLTSDEKGRLFVLIDSQIWLLIESGVPSETWHAQKRKTQDESWRSLLALDLPNLSGWP